MAGIKDIKVKISADIGQFNSEMKKLSSSLAGATKDFSGLAQAGDAIGGAGKKLMPFTLAVTGIGVASAKTAMDFQSSMNEVGAISGSTGKDLQKLEQVAIDMGKSTKFSSIEASEGLKYFAMAGYSAEEMVSALPPTLALATAGNTSLAETCDIVSDGMTAMGMNAKRTGEFADIMASTMSSSNTTISLMGETMKYVGPVAGSLGIEMKDLSVGIGLMANAGIKGSQSGTALKTGLVNLAKPTKQMQEAMSKYGIELKKNDDGSINLMSTMTNMRSKLGDLDQATQANVIATIFGKEAMAGWSAVINASEADFDKLVTKIDMSDTASRKLAEASKITGTSMDTLRDSVSIVSDKFGEGAFDADGMAVALTGMAQAGITGKEAGDALAGGLTALSMPVKSVQEAMKQYGVEVVKNSDGSLNLMGTIGELRGELGGLDEDTRKQALSSIVGAENMEAWNSVLAMSDEEFKKVSGSIGKVTGSAEEMRQKMSEGAKGAITEMSSALSEVGRTIGDKLLPMIEKCADWIGQMANKFLDLNPAVQDAIIIFAGVLAVIPPLLVLAGGLIKAWTGLKIASVVLGKSIGLLFTQFFIIPVAIAAVVAGCIWLVKNWDTVKEMAGKLADKIGECWDNIVQWTSEKWNAMWETISNWWNNLLASIGEWVTGVGESISQGWQACVDWTTEVWNTMWETIANWWNNLLESVGGWLTSVGDSIREGWETCKQWTQEVWDSISEVVSTVWETIKNLVSVGIMLVGEIIKMGATIIFLPWLTLWENTKDVIIPLWEEIKRIVSEGLENIKTFVSEKLEAVKTFFTEKWEFIKEKTSEVYQAIADYISEKLETAKNYVTEKLEAIKTFFTDGWNFVKEKTNEAYEAVATYISEKLETAKSYVTEKVEAIKTFFTNGWNSIKEKTNEVYQSIANYISEKLEQAKSIVSNATEAIKKYFSDKFEQAKQIVSNCMNSIKQFISDKINSAKDAVSRAIDNIKSKFDLFTGMATKVKETFDSIKRNITEKIDGAKEAVSKAIEKIKSILDINLPFPKIKMPHFSFSGKFSLNPPSVPKFSVKWYNQGAIFKRKTVLPNGMGVGDASFGGVGNSPEAILPIKKLPELLGLDKKNSDGGIVLNIEKFENNREQDVEAFANELAFHLKRKSLIGGN